MNFIFVIFYVFEFFVSLGVFLDNLKKEQAILIITEALKFGYERGLYDLKESESISKSLRILSTE